MLKIPGLSGLNRNHKIFIGIFLGATLLRLVKINESLAIDELLTIRDYISRGFSAIFFTYREPNNHILTSMLARISFLIFGHYNWAYKIPSFLLALWAIVLQLRLGRLWFDDDTALAASALLGGSFFHIIFSTQVRGYSGMVTATLFALVSFTLAFRENKNKDWLGLGAALVLGSYFHPLMLFPYVGCLLCGIYLYRRSWRESPARKFMMTFIGSALVTLILYSPLLGHMAEIYRYRTGPDFVSKLFLRFVAGYLSAGPLFTPATIVYFIFFSLGLWYLKDWPKRLGVILFFIIPVVGLKYIIQPTWLFTRFFIYLLPVFLLVVAYGVRNALQRRFWFGITLLLLFNIPILAKYYQTEIFPGADVVQYIKAHIKPDEWIIGTGFTRLAFYYYRDRRDYQVWFERIDGEETGTFVDTQKNKGLWFIDAARHDRLSDPVFSFRSKWIKSESITVGGRNFYFRESFRGLHPLGKTYVAYYSPPPPS